jgi:FkbM family methyltransferase
MKQLAAALGFFPVTPARHWPRLAFYFLGSALYRTVGLRLFSEIELRFGDFVVLADVTGKSGLAFLYEIIGKEIYAFPELWKDPPVRLLFDAGANCGFYAITHCARFPNLRAWCFEPQPNTFHHLQKNIEANRLQSRIRPLQAAVAANSGTCLLQISEESSMGIVSTSTTQYLKAPRNVEVQMISFDDAAARENAWPDLLKIDVEGFEVEVLKGAARCLEHARFVILEFHSEELGRQCETILENAHFTTWRKGELLFARKK